MKIVGGKIQPSERRKRRRVLLNNNKARDGIRTTFIAELNQENRRDNARIFQVDLATKS